MQFFILKVLGKMSAIRNFHLVSFQVLVFFFKFQHNGNPFLQNVHKVFSYFD